jgi:hypothetical protein
MKQHCLTHPQTEGLARCSSCSTPMCAECFQWTIHHKPCCEPCAFEKSTARTRALSFAISFFGFGLAVLIGLWIKPNQTPASEDSPLAYLIFGGLVFLGVSAWLFFKVVESTNEPLEPANLEREEALPPPLEEPESPSADPYRVPAKVVLRRMAMRSIPYASGFTTAMILLVSFALVALLLPLSLHLPTWVEAEVVLLAWWALLTTTLTTLLYRGWRLKDDLTYATPWSKPGTASSGSNRGNLGGLGSIGDLGSAGEGCAVILVIIVAGVLLLGAAWLISELVLPLVFFLAYWLTMKALGRVANDKHQCEGALARSLGYGVLWGLLYMAPIALVVLFFFRR